MTHSRLQIRHQIHQYLVKALRIGHRTESTTIEYQLLEKSAAMFETHVPEVTHA